jgi:hypothetical protein
MLERFVAIEIRWLERCLRRAPAIAIGSGRRLAGAGDDGNKRDDR